MTTLPYYKLPDPSTIIWRYLDLPKFLSLLTKKTMRFTRADLFDDRFEGSFTSSSIEEFREQWDVDPPKDYQEMMQGVPCHSFVSCWHRSDFESAAMWKIYARNAGSLAIESTIEKLQDSFRDRREHNDEKIISQAIGVVQYIDYKLNHPHIVIDWMGPLFYKREPFSYEKEIRVILQELPYVDTEGEGDSRAIVLARKPEDKGRDVPIDPNKLISAIHLAPLSPDYMKDAIKETMTSLGFGSIPCERSILDDLPKFGASKP